MYASQLIARLQDLVLKGGDSRVVPICDEDGEDVVYCSRELHAESNPLRLDEGMIGIYVSLPTFKEEEE